MKKLVIALIACLGLAGCVDEEVVYTRPVGAYATGAVEFCDDAGCRYVTTPYYRQGGLTYYYYGGSVVYWNNRYSCWVGPRGYWRGGAYYRGYVPGGRVIVRVR